MSLRVVGSAEATWYVVSRAYQCYQRYHDPYTNPVATQELECALLWLRTYFGLGPAASVEFAPVCHRLRTEPCTVLAPEFAGILEEDHLRRSELRRLSCKPKKWLVGIRGISEIKHDAGVDFVKKAPSSTCYDSVASAAAEVEYNPFQVIDYHSEYPHTAPQGTCREHKYGAGTDCEQCDWDLKRERKVRWIEKRIGLYIKACRDPGIELPLFSDE